MLSNFPTELIAEILSLAARDDLTGVCRTNRRLGAIAEGALYQDLVIRRARELVGCCRAIIANPALAKHVRLFDVHFTCVRTRENILPTLSRLVNHTLQRTPDLLILRLCFSQHHEWLLNGLQFPRLRSFTSITSISCITSDFLTRHPTITHLLLAADLCPGISSCEQFSLPTHALPLLQTFTGPSDLAKWVVPGSPVVRCSLSWHSYDPSDTSIYEPFEALSRSTGTVKSFNGLMPTWNEIFLDAAAQYLPKLESIGLTKDNALERIFGINDTLEWRTFLERAPVHLARFSQIIESSFVGMNCDPVYIRGGHAGPNQSP